MNWLDKPYLSNRSPLYVIYNVFNYSNLGNEFSGIFVNVLVKRYKFLLLKVPLWRLNKNIGIKHVNRIIVVKISCGFNRSNAAEDKNVKSFTKMTLYFSNIFLLKC